MKKSNRRPSADDAAMLLNGIDDSVKAPWLQSCRRKDASSPLSVHARKGTNRNGTSKTDGFRLFDNESFRPATSLSRPTNFSSQMEFCSSCCTMRFEPEMTEGFILSQKQRVKTSSSAGAFPMYVIPFCQTTGDFKDQVMIENTKAALLPMYVAYDLEPARVGYDEMAWRTTNTFYKTELFRPPPGLLLPTLHIRDLAMGHQPWFDEERQNCTADAFCYQKERYAEV